MFHLWSTFLNFHRFVFPISLVWVTKHLLILCYSHNRPLSLFILITVNASWFYEHVTLRWAQNDKWPFLMLHTNCPIVINCKFYGYFRANAKKILEFLCNQWAVDRKAEWSIWMVYTKAEMPHQYISSSVDDSSIRVLRSRGSALRKLNGDVILSP